MKRAAILIPLAALAGAAAIWMWRSFGSEATPGAPQPRPGETDESRAKGPLSPSQGTSRLAPPAPRGTGSLRVSVFSIAQPVAGANVTVQQEDGPGRKTFPTRADGTETVLQIPEGDYGVSVRHPGHMPQIVHCRVDAGRTAEVRIDLKPGGRIQGTVFDDKGRPLPETLVRLLSPKTKFFVYPELETRTDPAGRYLLDGVPVEELGLNCWHPRFKHWRRMGLMLRDAADVLEVDPVLEPGTTLSGRVVDERGAPLRGASVMGTNQENYVSETDAEGRFVLYGLGSGPVSMCVRARGYGTQYPRGIPADTQGLEFRLLKAGEISGRIQSAPFPDAFAIMLCRYEQDLGREMRVQAQAVESPDGGFILRDLAPGTYRVEVDAPGFEPLDKPYVVVSAGATTSNVTLRLKKSN